MVKTQKGTSGFVTRRMGITVRTVRIRNLQGTGIELTNRRATICKNYTRRERIETTSETNMLANIFQIVPDHQRTSGAAVILNTEPIMTGVMTKAYCTQ